MFASAQRAMAAQSCDVIVVVGARGSENTSGRLSDAMIASIAVVCVLN
jgi:thiamine pyrophosphate-dependent acetolactate synthase large subunit-like protein